MKRPFPVALRRWEKIAGLVWLAAYVFLMGSAVTLLLGLLGLPDDDLTRNKVFYIAGFLITAALLWRFLRDSLAAAAREPGRLIRGAVFGWCLYAAAQVGAGIVFERFAPELTSPNDQVIASLTAENFPMMLAATVLLTPLTEETLLRGVLFGSLREKSRPAAYAVTALVFAGMHLVPYLPEMDAGTAALNGLLYVLPSLVLCASYELGGTIWTPVLVHAAINGIGMLALRG